jgi:hypothetical protein
MSEPQYERDLNRRPAPHANRESTAGIGSMWVAAIIAILIIAGIAAYNYRDTQTVSNPPATTSGQSTRAPAAPATPADPAQRP